MADESQLRLLKTGVTAWNDWRRQNTDIQPDLRWANLRWGDFSMTGPGGANLRGADLIAADLFEANLSRTNLRGANLSRADLFEATLSRADLFEANLRGADLRGANLFAANLSWADLRDADLSGASLDGAYFSETSFLNVDLRSCKSLDKTNHLGPSSVDFQTLQRSGPLPLVFLRGVGLPDNLIDYLPALLASSIQLYSCFISYSSKDEDFARRLHADLQAKGVRCWFAPEDMKIGAKILDTLDEAIRLRDKVLLVLSEASIKSEWVEDEVTRAFAEERQRGQVVLFPVRVDDAVFVTKEAWATKLRDSRNIGDFRCWKDHDAYQKALDRVLRDLRVESA